MFIHILTLDKHNVKFGTSLTVSIKMIMNDLLDVLQFRRSNKCCVYFNRPTFHRAADMLTVNQCHVAR